MLLLQDGSAEVVEQHVGSQGPLNVVAVGVLQHLFVFLLLGFALVAFAR